MKQVLVTGASGFIGRHVLPKLIERDYEIHCTFHKSKPETISYKNNITWHQIDLLKTNEIKILFNNIHPSHLLHFAWDVTPGQYVNSVNNLYWLDATLHLVNEFIQSDGKRVICSGTCFEYDLRYGYCSENLTPIRPATFYGLCKANAFTTINELAKLMDFDFVWGRIFYPYGPFEYPTRLVPYIINSFIKNQKVKLTHGNQIRDYIYVADVADAFVKLVDSKINGPINIGSGKPISIRELVHLIGSFFGEEKCIEFGAISTEKNDPPFIVANIDRLKSELDWSPKHSLEMGIKKTVDWWKIFGVR